MHVRFVPSSANERIMNRAPSAQGEHPHLVRREITRAEFPYQYRDDVARNMPQNPLTVHDNVGTAPVVEKETSFHKWAALVLAATGVGLAAYAVLQRKQEAAHAPAPVAPVVVMSGGGSAPAVVETKAIIEEKKPRRRIRRTTQARDENGHFLPAGTRAKLKVEGV